MVHWPSSYINDHQKIQMFIYLRFNFNFSIVLTVITKFLNPTVKFSQADYRFFPQTMNFEFHFLQNNFYHIFMKLVLDKVLRFF